MKFATSCEWEELVRFSGSSSYVKVAGIPFIETL